MQLRMTDEPADLLYMATADLIFHHLFRLVRVPTYVATAYSVNVNSERALALFHDGIVHGEK